MTMPAGLSDEEQKKIIKEALKEWLDAQFAAFGKWTFMGLLSLLFVAVSYAWLWEHGWHK
jgi:hypothetical protein